MQTFKERHIINFSHLSLAFFPSGFLNKSENNRKAASIVQAAFMKKEPLRDVFQSIHAYTLFML
jgi:hypothetical protein